MPEPHIAVAELGDETYFLVGGLSVLEFSSQGAPGYSGERLFSALGLDLAQRYLRQAGCNLIVRTHFRRRGVAVSLLFSRLASRAEEQAGLAALVAQAAGHLQPLQAAALDRAGLDQVLGLPADWQSVRLSKPDGVTQLGHRTVTPLCSLNADLGGWRPLLGLEEEAVLDLALFPSQRARLDEMLRELAATSKVLGRHFPEHADGLDRNARSAAVLLQQRVYAATAVTLTAPHAFHFANDLLAWRHPLQGDIAGMALEFHELDADERSFAVLDCRQEPDAENALEPDARRPFDLAGLLLAAGQARLRQAQQHDPVAYLRQRLAMLQRQWGLPLEALDALVQIAATDVKTALAHGRRTMEELVAEAFNRCFPAEAKKPPPLERTIEKLREQGKIPHLMANMMHSVRGFGNLGAHAGHEADLQALSFVFEALAQLLKWHGDASA